MVTLTWEGQEKKSKLDRKDQSSLSPNQTRSTGYKEGKKVPRREKSNNFLSGFVSKRFPAACQEQAPIFVDHYLSFPARNLSRGSQAQS